MEPQLKDNLKFVFIWFILFFPASCENYWDLKFCGTWRHGRGSLSLMVNISTGCKGISVSANSSALSINGEVTAQCMQSDVIHLSKHFVFDSNEESDFCLFWEPLLDQMTLQFGGKSLTLCWPASLHGSCCTDLSFGPNTPEAPYGIAKGNVKDDFITDKTMMAYNFYGTATDCKTLCDQGDQQSTHVSVNRAGSQAVELIEHPCARSSEVDMKEDFKGYNVTSPLTQGASEQPAIIVQIPTVLKLAAKKSSKVVCTFFKNNSLFQESAKNLRILDDVVGITVENEVITDLPEAIRIDFHHDVIPKTRSSKCVSWDTRKDPLQVNWRLDGCETHRHGPKHTQCVCNHLTYFSILVQVESRPVCHLLALTVITSLGCAVSLISCVALIIYICKKRRHSKEQSISIHLGLAISFVFLYLVFFLTGTLANVGGKSVCTWVAASLHYALLTSFIWMGIEVFHTFWLVCMVFSPSPKPYVWNIVGFALPAVPVLILACVGDIYGVRSVPHCDDSSDPYQMCWMKDNNTALLAHYFTNLTLLAVLVLSGLVMLLLVYRQIRTREEWRQNRVAFLSIWGLSCLFGTTWGLAFLNFGPLSVFVDFFFCFLNSFQGFFLMLRFCMLDWMRKQTDGSSLGSTSSGSTKQHMLRAQEKS